MSFQRKTHSSKLNANIPYATIHSPKLIQVFAISVEMVDGRKREVVNGKSQASCGTEGGYSVSYENVSRCVRSARVH